MSDSGMDPNTLALLQQLLGMGGGVGPSYGPAELNNAYGLIPEGGGLTANLNQLQDVTDLMVDPMFQTLSGPDAYSREAFQPIVNWETVESPEYTRFQRYLASLDVQDSFEGLVADELRHGGTASTAIAKLRQKVTAEPEGPLAQMIQNSVAGLTDEMDPAAGYVGVDWNKAIEEAQKIEEMYAAIPPLGQTGATMAPDGTVINPGGEIVESVGPNGEPILLRRTEEPSELSEKFSELGFPSPYEEYVTEDFLPPDWSEEPYLEATAGVDPARQAMLAAYQEMTGFTPEQNNYPRVRRDPQTGRDTAGGPSVAETIAAMTPEQRAAGGAWRNEVTEMGGAASEAIADTAEAAVRNVPWWLRGATGLNPSTWAGIEDLSDAGSNAITGLGGMLGGVDVATPEQIAEWERTHGGGGAGSYKQAFSTPEMEARYRAFLAARGDEPVPPPGDLTYAGGPTELFTPQGQPRPPGPGLPGQPSGELTGTPVRPQSAQNDPARAAQLQAQRERQTGPASRWPPTLLYDPWATEQATDETMAANLRQTPTSPAAMWPPTLLYDPWGQQATPQTMAENLNPRLRDAMLASILPQGAYQAPPGGYATLEEARAAGSPAAADYLRENGPTPTGNANYQAPPGGYPTLEQAAAAGSTVAARYLEENGPTAPLRPQRHPEAPLGGAAYETNPAAMQAQRDAMLASVLTGGQRTGQRVRTGERPDEAPQSEQVSRTGERPVRTEAQRQALARANAPRALDTSGVALGSTTGTGRRGRYDRSRKQFRDAWLRQQQAKQATYTYEHGQAMGAAAALRAQGITPLNQVIAARMQNIATAGVPLGARPGLY
jgi:hypothetical protein